MGGHDFELRFLRPIKLSFKYKGIPMQILVRQDLENSLPS